jgi:two-component system chemotaxis response regulator CheB
VAEPSPLVRRLLRTILESDPSIRVVGEAENGLEAVAKVASLKPDLVTLDLEMPVLGGLQAIERIMAEHPLPILVVTAQENVRRAFDAVSKGALDVMGKVDLNPAMARTLVKKVKALARVDVRAFGARKGTPPALPRPPGAVPAPLPVVAPAGENARCRLLAIASSTGGPQALQAILSRLPAQFPAPILIAQHVASGFTQGIAAWLSGTLSMPARVARHGEQLEPGTVYFNPTECDLRVNGKGQVLLEPSAPSGIYHPSCDVLLRSAAEAYRGEVLALILTGMGRDGVEGMRAIKAAGGVTLAQNEASSVVFGMNRLAIEAGCIDQVLGLEELPAEILRRFRRAQA